MDPVVDSPFGNHVSLVGFVVLSFLSSDKIPAENYTEKSG
jgi:hypothetical protein